MPLPFCGLKGKKVKVNICYSTSTPNRLSHRMGAQVHGVHQAASHIPALNLPSGRP